MAKQRTVTENLISKIYKDPKYKGKHIIIFGGKIYATKTGRAKTEILEKLLKKYPKEIPTITYIPTEESLILL